MEFPGVLKEYGMCKFLELNKTSGISREVIKKKSSAVSIIMAWVLFFLPWNFQPTGLTQFCRISMGKALFCLKFSRKVTNLKILRDSIFNSLFEFFWNPIAICGLLLNFLYKFNNISFLIQLLYTRFFE